jgi:hypothetical protein
MEDEDPAALPVKEAPMSLPVQEGDLEVPNDEDLRTLRRVSDKILFKAYTIVRSLSIGKPHLTVWRYRNALRFLYLPGSGQDTASQKYCGEVRRAK